MTTATATMTFICGHAGEIPANMGRGEARQRRLVDHFGRECPECRKARLTAETSKLCVLLPGTDAVTGKRNFRRYNAEEIAAYVAKHVR